MSRKDKITNEYITDSMGVSSIVDKMRRERIDYDEFKGGKDGGSKIDEKNVR